jgi:hypothetical protein
VDDIAVGFFGVDEESCSKPGSIQPSATGKLLASPEELVGYLINEFARVGRISIIHGDLSMPLIHRIHGYPQK